MLFLRPSPALSANPKGAKGELDKIERRLKKEKSKIKKTFIKEKSILTEMEKINKALKKKKVELNHLDKRLSTTRSRLGRLKNDVSALNAKLKTRERFLKERLKSIYKQ